MLSKRNIHKIHTAGLQSQHGMTLLVGLVMLLLLTILSIVGFRNTTMSERITGNLADRNISFQSAESIGKEVLTVITTNATSGSNSLSGTGYYATAISQGGTSSFWTQGDGATVSNTANCATTTPFSWKSCSASVANKYANNASNGQYVIELLKADNSSGTAVVNTYRVTTRSTGGSGNADVVLQLNYQCSVASLVATTPPTPCL